MKFTADLILTLCASYIVAGIVDAMFQVQLITACFAAVAAGATWHKLQD